MVDEINPEHLNELILCKVNLAQVEESKNEHMRIIRKKDSSNKHLREKHSSLLSENKVLKDSISQISADMVDLHSQLEERAGVALLPFLSHPENESKPEIPILVMQDVEESWADWQSVAKPEKLMLMARKGIPKGKRGEIWSQRIGNSQHLNPNLFSRLLNKASSLEKAAKENNGIFIIPLDLMRTLGNLKLFQKEQPLHEGLQCVLEAFAAYRPDIGYIQGMGYVGAMLLIHLNTYKSFECMANMILGSEMLRTFYAIDLKGMNKYYKTFEYFANKKVPGILKLLRTSGITPDIYLLEWVYTLYVRCFTIDIASRIWDRFVFEGDIFIFRVGIAILVFLKPVLSKEIIDITGVLTNLTKSNITTEGLFTIIEKIQITDRKFKEILILNNSY